MAQALARALVDKALEKSSRPATRSPASAVASAAREQEEETPFARRAKEAGKVWKGGKNDGQFSYHDVSQIDTDEATS
jgi:hypothetical protein